MLKNLLRHSYWFFLLGACATATRVSRPATQTVRSSYSAEISSHTFDTALLSGKTPASLAALPITQDGAIILSPGYYETTFKSYCLQPGTPDPSANDAYIQQPLNVYRKDIIETALRNSLKKPGLEQRNIQLLLWSVVSGSDYNRLSWEVQNTAKALLSSKQIFQLKGGVMGVIKKVSNYLPGNSPGGLTEMKRLFEMGNSSYDAFERLAVIRQPAKINKADYKRDQWYWQSGGYFLRYFPDSYKQVKVQVYVPEGATDSSAMAAGNYLLFDPVQLMAAPANSDAQHLGIGAPVIEIIRKVIQINKGNTPKKPLPKAAPKDPKSMS